MTQARQPFANEPEAIPSEQEARVRFWQSTRAWWWLVGALALAILLGLGALRLIGMLAQSLGLVFLGLTIAAALAPVVNWLQQRGLSRTLAVLLVYLVLLMIAIAIGLVIVPAIITQVQAAAEQVPALIEQAQQALGGIGGLGELNLFELLASQVANLGSAVLALPVAIFSSLFDIVVIFFVSLYWLILIPTMRRAGLTLFPVTQRPDVEATLSAMGNALGGYVRGAVIDGAVVAVLAYIGFLIIGVDFALVLALIAGVLEFIPTLGPIISGAIAVGAALLESPTQALIVLIFFVALQQLENNILVPNIMRSQAHISPLLVIVALLIGSTLGGLLGALIAIPLAGALRVFVIWVVAPWIRGWTGAPPPQPEEEKENGKRKRKGK